MGNINDVILNHFVNLIDDQFLQQNLTCMDDTTDRISYIGETDRKQLTVIQDYDFRRKTPVFRHGDMICF